LIFVTVGNANQRFERLLQAVERAVAQGVVSEEVVVQAGNNPGFRPMHCKTIGFVPVAEFERLLSEARLVISHAGAGTLIQVLRTGKVPVVMPRRKKYGEHIDDHQMEIVAALADEGRVIPAYEPEDLPAALATAEQRGAQAPAQLPARMIALVSQAIDELLAGRTAANREMLATDRAK
jgi:beta-1,4-N-acetylglucosaminyltransferase